MTEERLSRLQKWILTRAYENVEHGEGSFGKWTHYEIHKREIYEDFFHVQTRSPYIFGMGIAFEFVDPASAKVKVVILSRSLRLLKERGYITSLALTFDHYLGQSFELDRKGIEKAKCIIGKSGSADYTLGLRRLGTDDLEPVRRAGRLRPRSSSLGPARGQGHGRRLAARGEL